MNGEEQAVRAIRLAADMMGFLADRVGADGIDECVVATALGLATGAVLAAGAKPGHLDAAITTHMAAVRSTALNEIARAAAAQ